LIGQGSDRLVESAIGQSDEAIADAHDDFYAARLHDLRAFERAAELLRHTRSAGLAVILATSASGHDAPFLYAAIDADDVIEHATTSSDADSSKPEPDIVQAALDATGRRAQDCIFVGDSVWDVEAARRAGMDCVCVLTGGIPKADLLDAGAIAIYDSVAHLLESFADSPLGALAERAKSSG
jgi:HAD superfamily hydrolase (TIGR01509 family)